MIGDFIKKILGNRDAKVLLENLLSLSALQVIGYIVPFVTIPYLAKVIGVEKFGILAFSTAVIVFFQTFTDFGFNYTAVRDIAKNREDQQKVSSIFCSVMIARVLLMLISFLFLILMINLFPQFQQYRLILLLSFLSVPGYIMFPEWFFQAMERMKYVTFMNLLSKAIFTGMIFIVVKDEADYVYVPVLTALGFLVSGSISILYILKKFDIRLRFPSWKEISTTILKSSNMFVSLFLPNLYTNASIIFLENFGGKAATGIFDGGNKFVGISQRIAQVLSRAFYPLLARRMDKHNLYKATSFIWSLFISLVLFFGAETIIGIFYTPEFEKSIIVLKIMSISPIFLYLMNVYGTNYLVLVNKENILRNIIVICSLLGFVLSYYMVSFYSYIGAAISIVLVWAVRGILTWLFAHRQKKRLLAAGLETKNVFFK